MQQSHDSQRVEKRKPTIANDIQITICIIVQLS